MISFVNFSYIILKPCNPRNPRLIFSYHGFNVIPNTKCASSKHGFQIACAKIGNENESVILIAVVAFNATLVKAKPEFPYPTV